MGRKKKDKHSGSAVNNSNTEVPSGKKPTSDATVMNSGSPGEIASTATVIDKPTCVELLILGSLVDISSNGRGVSISKIALDLQEAGFNVTPNEVRIRTEELLQKPDHR